MIPHMTWTWSYFFGKQVEDSRKDSVENRRRAVSSSVWPTSWSRSRLSLEKMAYRRSWDGWNQRRNDSWVFLTEDEATELLVHNTKLLPKIRDTFRSLYEHSFIWIDYKSEWQVMWLRGPGKDIAHVLKMLLSNLKPLIRTKDAPTTAPKHPLWSKLFDTAIPYWSFLYFHWPKSAISY